MDGECKLLVKQMQDCHDFFHKTKGWKCSNLRNELESREYGACTFSLDSNRVKFRIAKVTPTKLGFFVTLWKRNAAGITEPHSLEDPIDLYLVSVKDKNNEGVFVFPKEELARRGILSSEGKEGKRGFRVYPSWVKTVNKQAIKTQSWQVNCFYDFSSISY
ncbi:MAG: hypothetical protein S4CHLAM6_13300 [Chlamydiae bacterium]|nr:hypothetical protein [Chlamydiota bacterium]